MLEWLRALSWARILLETAAGVALALFIRRYICLLVYVKGRSMQDTLQNGEVLFALRKRLHGEIRRFDVVLCRYPGRKELFVKRVVALPGETISVDEDVLYVNGEAMEEPFPRRQHLRPDGSQHGDSNSQTHQAHGAPALSQSALIQPLPL